MERLTGTRYRVHSKVEKNRECSRRGLIVHGGVIAICIKDANGRGYFFKTTPMPVNLTSPLFHAREDFVAFGEFYFLNVLKNGGLYYKIQNKAILGLFKRV